MYNNAQTTVNIKPDKLYIYIAKKQYDRYALNFRVNVLVVPATINTCRVMIFNIHSAYLQEIKHFNNSR